MVGHDGGTKSKDKYQPNNLILGKGQNSQDMFDILENLHNVSNALNLLEY